MTVLPVPAKPPPPREVRPQQQRGSLGLLGAPYWNLVQKFDLLFNEATAAVRWKVVGLFAKYHDACRRGDCHDSGHNLRVVGALPMATV